MKYFILWLVFFIELLPSPISRDEFTSLIIWNVGQGQWSTLRNHSECLHFDIGGERAPFLKIYRYCTNRKNVLFLSHDDFDHIRFASWAAKKLHACWVMNSEMKLYFSRLKTTLQFCDRETDSVERIYSPTKRMKNANLQSFVYASNQVLFPGDAPIESERIWQKRPTIASIKYLMLGHHGSKTSTSEDLVKSMPSLQMAIASARRSRYGHPHFEVLVRMQKYKIPTLSTEDWGSIQLQL